jgi:microcystin degradation protein MlrC
MSLTVSPRFESSGRGPRVRRSAAPRIAIGGIAHETNTFSPVPTTLDDFRDHSYLVGDQVVVTQRGANSVLGGVIDEADRRGLCLLPTLFAAAPPAGVVSRNAWNQLFSRLMDRLRAQELGAWGLDGVLLTLHGAMVIEDDDDPEGTLLASVRSRVGRDVPVVATLDSHANVTPKMVASADVLVGYQTYPHVDTVERGREGVDILMAIRRGELRPVSTLRVLPLLAPLPAQRTSGHGPMREVMDRARSLTPEGRRVRIDIAGGFPYADVPGAGVSVRAVTDDDAPLSEALGDCLAAALWDRRDRFQVTGLSPDEAIDRAAGASPEKGPVVLADTGDNPGAGALGSDTTLLRRLLERGVNSAAVATIHDPVAVASAWAAGDGRMVNVRLGESCLSSGLDLTARVQSLNLGVFTARGPMASGGPTRMGRTALLRVDGVEVVVCERRVAAIDPWLFRAVGIEPASRQMLVVKSSVHFRAAFEALTTSIHEVETAGLSRSSLTDLTYRRVCRPIFPLDAAVRCLD